jgi:hypothetical protein
MNYLKLFENFTKKRILIIVDVQKSFEKFFNKNYLAALNNYSNDFDEVYQIFDNHHEGKNPDKDFLYDETPDIENKNDLYRFNKQVGEPIEKRYNYNVNVDFYKKILSNDTYYKIKEKEINNLLKRGDYFNTTEGTIIVYIGNNHRWFHTPIKLYSLLKSLKNEEVVIVGGSSGECILDVMITAKTLGLKIFKNDKYIYSATDCPIK